MSLFNCECDCKCNVLAIIASIIIGVVTAFLQITGVITITAAFLWVVFGIAVVYLAVLLLSITLTPHLNGCGCKCTSLNIVLFSILATALLSVVLLAVGVVATSVVSAILSGLLLLFLSLTISGTACFVKCLANCEE